MLISLFLSSISSFLITYFFIPIFRRKSWVSLPNERTSHRGIIPVGGSLGFIIVTLLSYLMNSNYEIILFIILALIGLIDDLNNLGTRFRLLVQSVIGVTYCSLIFNETLFGTLHFLDYFLLIKIGLFVFMVFTFVGVINFTNFADGLDGLLTGSMIILFSTASYLVDRNFIALVGGLTGFMILNWNPAKVFMGDSGSYFLGALYFSSIFLSDSWSNFLALIIIGTPIYLDTAFCVIRRAFDKQNIFEPHKLHLFQRLNRNGLSHWQVSLLYMSSILLLALSFILGSLNILIITFFIVLIFGFYLDRFIAIPFSS